MDFISNTLFNDKIYSGLISREDRIGYSVDTPFLFCKKEAGTYARYLLSITM